MGGPSYPTYSTYKWVITSYRYLFFGHKISDLVSTYFHLFPLNQRNIIPLISTYFQYIVLQIFDMHFSKFDMQFLNFYMHFSNFDMHFSNFDMHVTRFDMHFSKFDMQFFNFDMHSPKLDMHVSNFDVLFIDFYKCIPECYMLFLYKKLFLGE